MQTLGSGVRAGGLFKCVFHVPPLPVTLRSVSEVLGFAVAYSAEQLKRACLQFICVNAASLLEGRWGTHE